MAAKKKRFRTAIDDIEEAVKIGDKMNNTRVTTRGENQILQRIGNQYFVEQGMRVIKDQSHKEKGSRTEMNELKYMDQLLEGRK